MPTQKRHGQTIAFSSAQDPRSWDPSIDFGADAVITCMTNADAKKAEQLFNELLARAEKAEAALAARPEEGMVIVPIEPPESIPSGTSIGSGLIAPAYDEELFNLCRNDDYRGLYRVLIKRARMNKDAS